MVVLGSFVLPPPLWDFKEDSVWFHFAHFLVSALIGLLFVPMIAWADRRHSWRWWWVTAVSLSVGIGMFFLYQSLRANWTRTYAGGRIVIGETYKQDALDYKQRFRTEHQRDLSDEELIMKSAGDTKSIWQEKEMRRRRLSLAGVYMAIISLFAISIITLIQALYCMSKPKRRGVH
jgi:hypothetical protein